MKDRLILITGASSGIGLATARLLAGGGARLFLLGRSAARLAEATGDLPATRLEADVTDPGALAHAVTSIEVAAGRLDVLINCAGQLEVGPAADAAPDLAERLMAVNYFGAVRATHLCLPLLRRGERAAIVNVSSLAGRLAPPFMAAYVASKFALTGYTRSLRQELAAEGIHVGLVLPGPVQTPMVEGRLGTAHYPRPRGVPVLTPGRVAEGILRILERRASEVVLPRRLGPLALLGSVAPSLVDRFYRGSVRTAAPLSARPGARVG